MPGVTERVAVLGAGKMGEALLSGLLRAGRAPDDLLFTERHDERTKLLEERYGITGVTTARRMRADMVLSSRSGRVAEESQTESNERVKGRDLPPGKPHNGKFRGPGRGAPAC